MRKTLFSVFLLSTLAVNAQIGKVGVNTNNPKATLDIQPTPTNALPTATTNEGILIPKLSKTRVANIAAPEDATMIYVGDVTYTGTNPAVADITSKGFYYYDEDPVMPVNSKWKKLNVNAGETNLYNTDGSLTDNRTVNMNGKNLYFTGTGKVGVGTNSPTEKLHVKDGGIYVENGALISSRSTIDGGALSLRNPSKASSDASNWVLYNMKQGVYGANSLQFWRYSADGTRNAMAMTIADDGNVGIGTSNPGLKLHIQTSQDHKIRLQNEGSADFNDILRRNDGTFSIYQNVGGGWRHGLSVATSGNVGLGTEGPGQKLHVEGNSYMNGWLHTTQGARISGVSRPHSGADLWVDGHTDTNTLNVRSGLEAVLKNKVMPSYIGATQCSQSQEGTFRYEKQPFAGMPALEGYLLICAARSDGRYTWRYIQLGAYGT